MRIDIARGHPKERQEGATGGRFAKTKGMRYSYWLCSDANAGKKDLGQKAQSKSQQSKTAQN